MDDRPDSRAAATVFDRLADCLHSHGTRTLYGLLGDANLFFVHRFVHELGGDYVAALHESNAVLMACGHACIAGEVAVATVTHGPALANCVTALYEGVKGRVPIVVIAGDTAVADKHNPQNIAQHLLVHATGAGFEPLRAAATVAEDVATAYRRARQERRPIVLNCPVDVLAAEVAAPGEPLPLQEGCGPDRHPAAIDRPFENAIGILAASARPMVLAGRGAGDAVNAICALAKRLDAPLTTTLKAKGMFDGRRGDLGLFGTLSDPTTVEAILRADCVVAFGATLNQFTTAHGAYLTGKRVVAVNIDRSDMSHFQRPDAAVLGDAGLVAEQMIAWLDEAEIPASGFVGELGAMPPPAPAAPEAIEKDGRLQIVPTLKALDRALPADRILVTDGGRFMTSTWRAMAARGPASFLYTVHSGAIGLGMGYAIGAWHCQRQRPVVLVTGDGGFMMSGLQEFSTAVRTGARLVVIICNDGAYGAEHVQFARRQMEPCLSTFDWPDLAAVARTLGGDGIALRSAGDLEAVQAAIAAADGPLLIDMAIDPWEVPAMM